MLVVTKLDRLACSLPDARDFVDELAEMFDVVRSTVYRAIQRVAPAPAAEKAVPSAPTPAAAE